MTGQFNVLLTSVGRRSYLVKYFKEALQGIGKIYVSNSNAYSPAFVFADDYVVTPLIYDNKYIPFLIDYCKNNDIKLIVPLFDIDVYMLSQNKTIFQKNGIAVIVSDIETVKICNDKWKMIKFLKQNGLDVPHTYIKINDCINDLENDVIKFPVIIKPRWGMGSIGIYQADDIDELKIFYNKVKKDIEKSYLKYESNQDIECNVILQEKIIGQEYGLDVINDLNANYKNTIVKKKLAMRAGETDCAVVVNDTTLKNLGKKLSEQTKHIANLDIDIIVSENGYYVLDLNARFGGGYPFSYMVGVNLPKAIVNWYENIDADSDLEEKYYDIVIHKDLEIINLNSVYLISLENKRDVIEKYLVELDRFLKPSLKERDIDYTLYSDKIEKNAIILVCQNILKEPLGIAVAYMNDKKTKQAYLSLLIVNAQYQRNNIGSKLLSQIEELAKANGMNNLKLQVRNYNLNALKFYKKHGYTIIEKASSDSSFMLKNF